LGKTIGQYSYFYTGFVSHGGELQPVGFQFTDANFTAKKPEQVMVPVL